MSPLHFDDGHKALVSCLLRAKVTAYSFSFTSDTHDISFQVIRRKMMTTLKTAIMRDVVVGSRASSWKGLNWRFNLTLVPGSIKKFLP